MRLITHNMLICNTKVCLEECGDSGREGESSNFPLKIVAAAEAAEAIVEKETEFNPELVQAMLPKLHWGAFRSGVADLGIGEVPEALPMGEALTGDVLRALHKFLFDIHLMEGQLVCRHCNRAFPVSNGVPNMLLNEDEV